MSSAYNLPKYREKYFEYTDLDKINGQPTIDSILKLLQQVKCNTQRVSTTLGGGKLGYLALVIDATTYNSIPGLAYFNQPTAPGIFLLRNQLG